MCNNSVTTMKIISVGFLLLPTIKSSTVLGEATKFFDNDGRFITLRLVGLNYSLYFLVFQTLKDALRVDQRQVRLLIKKS